MGLMLNFVTSLTVFCGALWLAWFFFSSARDRTLRALGFYFAATAGVYAVILIREYVFDLAPGQLAWAQVSYAVRTTHAIAIVVPVWVLARRRRNGD